MCLCNNFLILTETQFKNFKTMLVHLIYVASSSALLNGKRQDALSLSVSQTGGQ